MDPDMEILMRLAAEGDQAARGRLLQLHRDRLCALIALRMHPRLAARLDPSDVVQEALIDADRKLTRFLQDPPLPLYIWLRQLTLERLTALYRRHVQAQKRSVWKEERPLSYLTDDSVDQLAEQLIGQGSSPSAHLRREEARLRARQALALLKEQDREVLTLRFLEQLTAPEIAVVLGIPHTAVKMRCVRALQRLRELIDERFAE